MEFDVKQVIQIFKQLQDASGKKALSEKTKTMNYLSNA